MSESARNDGATREKVNVITEARPSYEDEFRARRRRYVIMMLMRLPLLVVAAALYHHPWWAALIILVSIPLPWMAVMIANDGPARKKMRARRGVINSERALTGPPPEVIEGSPEESPSATSSASSASSAAAGSSQSSGSGRSDSAGPWSAP